MTAIHLQDKTVIERFLWKNMGLHIYSIGDLDGFFWPFTTWYEWVKNDVLKSLHLMASMWSKETN